MHMSDALLSPTVGVAMWAVAAGTIAYCSRKVRKELDDRKVPLMGVLGAVIFAAQMINFTIPITGSSGHLGGGLILAILLGPYAAFLTMASVLIVQALFFADGGLLALGCNIFNLGFFPSFIAYPFIYKKISGAKPTPTKISVASLAAAIIALQMGALGVVLETVSSGIASLPFASFVILMQPIHLAIGIVEGLITAALVSFVYKAKPQILQSAREARPMGNEPVKNVVLALLVMALLTGGVLSWFASQYPDGLEWSIAKVTGREELKATEEGLHGSLAAFQERLSFLPDYSFPKPGEVKPERGGNKSPQVARGIKTAEKKSAGSRLDTSVAGTVGGLLTLAVVFISGFLLKKRVHSA
jgi:cobalt/nickel transport system permease protein